MLIVGGTLDETALPVFASQPALVEILVRAMHHPSMFLSQAEGTCMWLMSEFQQIQALGKEEMTRISQGVVRATTCSFHAAQAPDSGQPVQSFNTNTSAVTCNTGPRRPRNTDKTESRIKFFLSWTKYPITQKATQTQTPQT